MKYHESGMPSVFTPKELQRVFQRLAAEIIVQKARHEQAGNPHDSPQAWQQSRRGEYLARYSMELLGALSLARDHVGGMQWESYENLMSELEARAGLALKKASELNDEWARMRTEYECEAAVFSGARALFQKARKNEPLPAEWLPYLPASLKQELPQIICRAEIQRKEELRIKEAWKPIKDAAANGHQFTFTLRKKGEPVNPDVIVLPSPIKLNVKIYKNEEKK